MIAQTGCSAPGSSLTLGFVLRLSSVVAQLWCFQQDVFGSPTSTLLSIFQLFLPWGNSLKKKIREEAPAKGLNSGTQTTAPPGRLTDVTCIWKWSLPCRRHSEKVAKKVFIPVGYQLKSGKLSGVLLCSTELTDAITQCVF